MSTLSCGLTHKPIRDGNRAVLMLLAEVPVDRTGAKSNSQGALYPSDFHTPICFPIRGVADSTHSFTPDDNPMLTVFLSLILTEWAISIPKGNNPIHEPAIDPKKFSNFEAVMEALCQDRLRLKPVRDGALPVNVSRTFYHEDAYLALSGGFWRNADDEDAPHPLSNDYNTYITVQSILDDTLQAHRPKDELLDDLLSYYSGDPWNNLLRTRCQAYDCAWSENIRKMIENPANAASVGPVFRNAYYESALRLAALAEFMAWNNQSFQTGYIASEDEPHNLRTLWKSVL